MSQPSPWWNADNHADRRPFLIMRGRIKAAIRAWFVSQGFIEVETACLQVSPGNETHLHAFATELVATDLSRRDLYLHTSPEFAMKKLLAAGAKKIFTFAPVFRNRERGALHAPEFTMLEWYRTDAPYGALWDDCAAILRIAAETSGHTPWTFRGKVCDPLKLPGRRTVEDVFTAAGVGLGETLTESSVDRDALAARVRDAGIQVGKQDSWSDIFSRVIVEKVEPSLGLAQPDILYRYPANEAALARPDPLDPRWAERFELYACGVELANGFGELIDAGEQRCRFENWMAEKSRIYGERYPIDEDFLAALAKMPPASGCALGFDRLVMLAVGAERVDQVIWTPLADGGN
jgi:elongation factor P--(R)-beta-lysine ligase